MQPLAAALTLLTGVLAAAGPAAAVPLGYTDRAAFLSAIADPQGTTVTNFDSIPAETLIASGSALDGITFTYDLGGVSLKVGTGFDTSSGPNFLATDDGGNALQDGDNLAFGLLPTRAFGLTVISADPLFDGDFVLSIDGFSVQLIASAVQQTFADGGKSWFLGIIDHAAPFSAVRLTADSGTGGTAFVYTLDDLTVPAPGAAALLLLGLAALRGRRRG